MLRFRPRRFILFICFIGVLTVCVNLPKIMYHFSYKQVIWYAQTPPLFESYVAANLSAHSVSGRPWFMTGGRARPIAALFDRKKGRRIAHLWPEEDPDDRIVNQLMFVPPNLDSITSNGTRLKKILFYNGITRNWKHVTPGRYVFLRDKCPVNTCTISTQASDMNDADAVFFNEPSIKTRGSQSPHQVWIIFLLESPHYASFLHQLDDDKVFNWTATYRHDSDIVAPYAKFVPFYPPVKTLPNRQNFAANKIRRVAWFVSNCQAHNNRLQYGLELAKHIDVDIYGDCGTMTCPRSQEDECFAMLDRDYKFYLSFENANCKDYITEKFFVNGLSRDVIPIVMGAQKEDYVRVAPPHSFIYAGDFKSPKDLAKYLHELDANDTLYNEYFAWKGTGEFINSYFMCRMCAMLHDTFPYKSYNMKRWWSRDLCENEFTSE